MGEQLNPPNETNPKGQFEDREVNSINEEILAQVTSPRPSNIFGGILFKTRPVYGQRWLSRVSLETDIPSSPHLESRIQNLVKNEPYCFKDPRFSYTLSSWRPFLNDPVFVCVFRHPAVTANSMLNQMKKVPHLKNFALNTKQAFQVWNLMYSHILKIHYPAGGDWVFLHYLQFFDGSAHEKLEKKLAVSVDRTFVDSRLNRSKQMRKVDDGSLPLYDELCALADFQEVNP
jgi:hypothetical protein